MKRDDATARAREIHENEGVAMVVTRNPYSETPASPYEYYPASAARIFAHELVVERFGDET